MVVANFFFEIDRHRDSDSGGGRPADFIKVLVFFFAQICQPSVAF